MKLLRAILFPITLIYFFVSWLRNWLYDRGFKSSKSYNFPIICVGNLSTGGTGKTPMIEYLVRLLQPKFQLATLSRGYKRVSSGFVLADSSANVATIGDEPFQFYNKFKAITVAVDENRQHGIAELMRLRPNIDVILLDDAYQHRKVRAGFNIVLTAYNNLYSKDMVLPTGNLREPRFGAKRANVIMVTKCPLNLSDNDKNNIIKGLKPKKNQHVFFSHITYANKVFSKDTEISLDTVPSFTLITGIANATPLVDFLRSKGLQFDHLVYGDHYNYRPKDIELFEQKDFIITTEKDFMRMSHYESLDTRLFYLPIEVAIDKASYFDTLIDSYINTENSL